MEIKSSLLLPVLEKNNSLSQNTVVGTIMTNKALEDYFLEKN